MRYNFGYILVFLLALLAASFIVWYNTTNNNQGTPINWSYNEYEAHVAELVNKRV